jgi:hypothetical protein
MRYADNIGNGARWEDPRDTFGGETDNDLPTHEFLTLQRFGYKRIRSKCTCGWLSNYYIGDMAEIQAKTAWVQHQAEWLRNLA